MNSPATVLGLVMLALWYRALYGSGRRVVLFTALMLGGLVLAVPVGSLLPGREGSPISVAVLASLPVVVVLTMVVARHHALCLFSRSQSRERDAALVRLGHDLIGLTDRAAIHARSRECSSAICAATPQMRALFVLGAGPERRIEVHAGRFRGPPATLGPSVLPAEAGLQRRPWPVLETDELDVAAGVRCQWVALPLPEEPDGWLILGTPHRVPPEAVAAMQSMINQAALALRTSAAHQDLATQAQTGRADRAAEPGRVHHRAGVRHRRPAAATRAAVHRPRRLQAGQRPVWARRGRRAATGHRGPAVRLGAPAGHVCPAGRRRVRRAAAGRRGQHGGHRPQVGLADLRTGVAGRPDRARRGEHRGVTGRRRLLGGAAGAAGRHRHVRGQGQGQEPGAGLRAGSAAATSGPGSRPSWPRPPAPDSSSCTTSRSWRWPTVGAWRWRRWCVGSTRRAGCSDRESSSRSRRAAGRSSESARTCCAGPARTP